MRCLSPSQIQNSQKNPAPILPHKLTKANIYIYILRTYISLVGGVYSLLVWKQSYFEGLKSLSFSL